MLKVSPKFRKCSRLYRNFLKNLYNRKEKLNKRKPPKWKKRSQKNQTNRQRVTNLK